MSLIKVLALTLGANVPSSRFRVRKLIGDFSEFNISIDEKPAKYGSYPPLGIKNRLKWLPLALSDSYSRVAKSNCYDLCILQKPLISKMLSFEPFIKIPYIFDIDDAIHLNMHKKFIEYIAVRAEHIVCGNQYLAEYYSKFNDVTILPTAVDVNYFKPLEQEIIKENDEVIIGWSGSSSGYMYLYLIESYLKVILNKYPNVRLKIISDLPPNFKNIPNNKLEYVQWSQFNEVRELQSIDIGLMPLSYNQWSLGKCSYKMLTYMSSSLPVVVSNVGMNSEVFHGDSAGYVVNNDESWIEALSSLIENKKLRVSKGTEGRRVIINNYSNKQIVPQYADLMKRILN